MAPISLFANGFFELLLLTIAVEGMTKVSGTRNFGADSRLHRPQVTSFRD